MDAYAQIVLPTTGGAGGLLTGSDLFFEDTGGNEALFSASSLSIGQGGGDVTTITGGKVELVFDDVVLPFTIDVNGITFPDATVQTTAFTDSYLPLAGGTMTGTLYVPTIGNILNTNLVIDAYNDDGAGTHNYFTFNPYGGGLQLPSGSAGITFGNASVQTIAFPGFNNAALTGNPTAPTPATSDNDTSIATTAFVVGQAGTGTPIVDGTAAVGTSLLYARQDHVHPTDTTRAALASPTLTGTPLSTTAAVDTNTTQIATTAYVVGQGYAKLASPTFTGSPLSTTAAVDTNTTQIATTAYVVGQGYAKLASPTFTGTPTLPTGSIGVTQSPGNNTTAVATTAFVTAAVPAFATVAQSRAGTSTAVSQNPSSDLWQMMNPGFIPIIRSAFTYTATGTMGTVGLGNYTSRMTMGTLGAVSGSFRTFGGSQIDQAYICVSKGYRSYIDFSRVTWFSGRFYTEDTWTDPQVTAGFYFGKAQNSSNGDLARKGFGWKLTGNATAGSRNPVLQVHNGTTLTNVTTSFALVAQQYFDWDVVSLGNGTVTLYINGTQYATTALGPTGDTSYSGTAPVIWNEEFLTTGTTAAYNATFSRGLLYIAP